MRKMSLTRALAELKLIDNKIVQEQQALIVGGIVKGAARTVVTPNATEASTKQAIDSSFQKINDLLANRKAIKKAITLANSSTKVTIGSDEMTIAEAIDMKKFIEIKQALLNTVKSKKILLDNSFNQQIALYEKETRESIQNILNKDKKNNTDTSEEVKSLTQTLKSLHYPEVFYGEKINVDEFIKTLEEEVNQFILNVDFALSEINAKTEIEV